MSSIDDISNMLNSESEKLRDLVKTAETKPELSIHEIVDTYYQIMNVSSMATMLKQQLNENEHKPLLEKITTTEQIIANKFNTHIHPKILEKLSNSIQDMTKSLQSKNSEQKSKDDAENEAKLYENLRKMMSTKEFVEQYGAGLSHD